VGLLAESLKANVGSLPPVRRAAGARRRQRPDRIIGAPYAIHGGRLEIESLRCHRADLWGQVYPTRRCRNKEYENEMKEEELS
jgi:hypothetical protein